MQRLNHHHLYIFWILAKKGTFTKTAEELSIAQSAVTAQIKLLEESLGMVLVDRSNRRRASLTSEGQKVLEFADSIFESSLDLLKWATQGEIGSAPTIRIGALSGLSRNLQYEFLQPIVKTFAARIEVTTGDQEKLVRLLKEHSLDIILSSHNVKLEGKTPFYSHVLTKSPVVFVIKADARLGTKIPLKEYFESFPLFIPGRNFEARPELDAFLKTQNRNLRIIGEVDDIALLRLFAMRSGAVVALPEMGVKSDLESKDLFLIGRAGKIEQKFYAVTREKRFPIPIVEKLIENMKSP